MEKKYEKGLQLKSSKDMAFILANDLPLYIEDSLVKKGSCYYYGTHIKDYYKCNHAVEVKCLYSLTNEQKRKEFERVAKPVIKFINNYYHPHTKVIIDCDSAEVLEGALMSRTDEFIKD